MWGQRTFTIMGIGLLNLVLCMALSTMALSAEYETPDVEQPGRTIHGKVVTFTEHDRATGKCDASVENLQTGEVVQLHLDQSTERKRTDKNPTVGDKVIVKYDEQNKHALSFVIDIPDVVDTPKAP